MPNLRPVTEEGGEAKINITPQLINEIFEEYPKVKIAYDKNVPNKITEEAFWRRYVQSKFNDRNRASATSAVDDIFDKCWTETEDDLNQEREHGRKRLKISNLRDLSATKEDHMEIDFAPDVTMRAGQGKILSLLRRNNRHGERIIETACEKSHRYKEAMAQQQEKEVYTEDIVMDDLIEEELPNTYKLDIMDQREYFASQAAEIDNDVEMVDAEQSSIKHQSSIESLSKFQENFKSWSPNLTKSLFPKKVEFPIPNLVTKECNEMIKDKQNRARESKPKIENLPQRIEKEINIIQLMGNEFLRHFWASADSTIKEKVEKNKRMNEQLKSILEKIDNIFELQLPDDDNKQGLNLPNGTSNNNNVIQKGQKSDREQRIVAINGKRLKITSRTSGSSSEQISGNRLDSNGSPRIDLNTEWKEALIQAQQILDPLRKAINKALTHNQGTQHPTSPNISRPNSRTSQNLQKSVVRTSSPDHHRTVSRDLKATSSPDLHKTGSKSTSPDIQRPISRDIKQVQHNGMQRTVNREAKQVTSVKIQKSSNHDMQQSSSLDVQVQRSNRKIVNVRQDTSRVNSKVNTRGTTQVQAARPDTVNREAVPSRTTIRIPKRNIQQTANRDDRQSNGRDTHPTTNHVSTKSSNAAPPRVSGGSSESSAQVSSTNRIKLSTKRKR